MSRQYNEEIQVLRAVAIALILVHHCSALFNWDLPRWVELARGLWVGVDLFLAISGYVIARSLLPRLEGLIGVDYWRETGAFWVKRFYRITPSAWLWLVLPLVFGHFATRTQVYYFTAPSISDVVAAVLHVANLHEYNCTVGGGTCGLYTPYWTLSLEEQFYVALPFLIVLCGARLRLALVIIVLLQVFLTRPAWVGLFYFIRTDALCLGVLLAMFSRTAEYHALDPNLTSTPFRFIVPPLLIASLVAATRYDIVSFSTGLAGVVAAIAVWLASYDKGYLLGPSAVRNGFSFIGRRSYAIYLVHVPAYLFTREIWARIEPSGTVFDSDYTVPYILTAFVLTMSAAELNFRFVEEPFRKRGQAIAKRMVARRARAQTVPPPSDPM